MTAPRIVPAPPDAPHWPAVAALLRTCFADLSVGPNRPHPATRLTPADLARAARRGALLSAALIPPLGLLGIVVGLYLRGRAPELAANTAQALPFFINQTFPPALAAFFLAGLLVIVLGTGAGLALGVTTNLHNDLLVRLPGMRQRANNIMLIRIGCVAIILLAAALAWLSLHTAILEWSYVAMGLRGTAVFAGLCLVVFFRNAPWIRAWRPLLFALPVVYLLFIALR